jgi:N-acetylglutamate synthase-like GNAT family acetyltransferase
VKSIEIELCRSLPPRDELNGILSQYYELFVQRMRDMGYDIEPAIPQRALEEFWTNSGDYMPPTGCLVVARKGSGEIVGCGMMKRLDQHTGEMKRMFVTQEGRGTGVGRKLIKALENAARNMGLKRLIADTLTPNVEMRDLFPKLGFVELDEPIETTTYNNQPMLRPHLHYFSKDL